MAAPGSDVTYDPHTGYHIKSLNSTGAYIFKCTGIFVLMDVYNFSSVAVFHLSVLGKHCQIERGVSWHAL